MSAQAIEVVVEAGDSGPITPIGVNLPNDQRIREKYGSKSVSLSNVLDAYERSMPDSFRQEFAWDDAEVERAKRWGAFASELTTEIHEVLGHGSGRMADHITVTPQDLLKEQYSALEETRADLVALYFVADPYLATIGLVPADEQQAVVQTEYEAYARNALVQLRRVRVGAQLEEDHMRNRQAIVHWLLANTRAIDVRRRDEKTYFVVVDSDAFRDGVAKLLAEVQRIKSEGDYAAAKELFETYGVHFDPEMRDEVVARVDHLKLPSYTGFVMPKLEPVTDGSGKITDVKISYPCDLTTQMLEYSGEWCRTPAIAVTSGSDTNDARKRCRFCRSRCSVSRHPRRRSRCRSGCCRPRMRGRRPRPAWRRCAKACKGNGRRTAIRAIGRLERPEMIPLDRAGAERRRRHSRRGRQRARANGAHARGRRRGAEAAARSRGHRREPEHVGIVGRDRRGARPAAVRHRRAGRRDRSRAADRTAVAGFDERRRNRGARRIGARPRIAGAHGAREEAAAARRAHVGSAALGGDGAAARRPIRDRR